MGLRFRLHQRDLPGRPDIVLPKHRVVIFVHGCFWHHHPRCEYAYMPKSRTDFWTKKFEENRHRDRHHALKLRNCGWRVITIWECQTECPDQLESRLKRILG